uniref:Nucleoprotein n=1 Tax=Crocidura tanakae nairovirus 1 TaxID=3139554 RepID=A0AB38ZK82_9VIRU
MVSVPDLSAHLRDAASARTDQERDATYSRALVAATKFAAPLKACAWTSCTSMVANGLNWFEVNFEDPSFQVWHSDYENLKSNPPTMDQLIKYQQCALKWRKDTGYGIMPETAILYNTVVSNFAVPSILLLTVQDMVKDIIARRGGGVFARKPVNPDHINCCQAIAGGNFCSIMNPSWGELDKVNSNGQMLLATGFANLMGRNGPGVVSDIQQVIQDFSNWNQNQDVYDQEKGKWAVGVLNRALDESQKLGGGSATYRAQIAQIDTAFSSYYWIWRAGITASTFSSLSDFMFELGQNPRGSTKIMKALATTGFKWGKSLLNIFADSSFKKDRIHMHPAVLTSGRLSELGVCFGVVPAARPLHASLGSGFAKSILNVKTSGDNPAANIVTQLFDIQRQAKPLVDLEVVSSEHLLHQILVSKKSPFQNAFQVSGNATDVNITSALMDYEVQIDRRPAERSKDEGPELTDLQKKLVVEARAGKISTETRQELAKLEELNRIARQEMKKNAEATRRILRVEEELKEAEEKGKDAAAMALGSAAAGVGSFHPGAQTEQQVRVQTVEAHRTPNTGVHYKQMNYTATTPVTQTQPIPAHYFMPVPAGLSMPLAVGQSHETSTTQVQPVPVQQSGLNPWMYYNQQATGFNPE